MTMVRVLVSIAGVSFSYAPGEVVELEDAEARRWITAGVAEAVAVEREPAPETATKRPRENTARRAGKPRG